MDTNSRLEPPSSPPGSLRRFLPRATAVAGLLLVGGSATAVAITERHVEHDTSTRLEQDVSGLRVDSHEGRIEVVADDRADVAVRAARSWTGSPPGTSVHRRDGTLEIGDHCDHLGSFGWVLGAECNVDYLVRLPGELPVTIASGTGTVVLQGLRARLDVDAGTGDVRATDLRSEDVTISNGIGDVVARFLVAPRIVTIESGTGNVVVGVPAGRYAITTDTGIGDATIREGIVDDPSSPYRISIDAGVGDVVLEPIDG